ncbi:tRNA N(3)-methylcytidine methyltransferase METTL6 [Trichonephila clavipes]|nr:tRNA N(3)-methylcytidine methyltransferase METTL6 [Trichonephila clavipes]
MSQGFVGHHARILNDQEIEKLFKDKVVLSDFKQNKLEIEAKKNWDLFYKRNKTKFFKDRHWTKREFEELACNVILENDTKPNLLEIGCGVGNFIFPLISEGTAFFIHACDFSPRAIDLVKVKVGWPQNMFKPAILVPKARSLSLYYCAFFLILVTLGE